MSTDTLECMEVFLVAYTCFNLNLEIFAETGQTGNTLYVHSPLLKTQLRK
jgi:hypothetical protein